MRIVRELPEPESTTRPNAFSAAVMAKVLLLVGLTPQQSAAECSGTE